MIFQSTSGLNIYYRKFPRAKKFKFEKTLLLLHGFASSSADWNIIADTLCRSYQIYVLDLPGFGKSSKPDDPKYYTASSQINILHEFISHLRIKNLFLVGYSMGGRLALQYAVRYAKSLTGLALESSTPGISDLADRKTQRQKDILLAHWIRMNTMHSFVNYWESLPLFSSQQSLPDELKAWQRKRRLKNIKIGLMNSILSFGQGMMPSVWNRMITIKIPVLLISGKKDHKYQLIQEQMSECLSNSITGTIKGAGHNTHLEKPKEFIKLVKSFIDNIS